MNNIRHNQIFVKSLLIRIIGSNTIISSVVPSQLAIVEKILQRKFYEEKGKRTFLYMNNRGTDKRLSKSSFPYPTMRVVGLTS